MRRERMSWCWQEEWKEWRTEEEEEEDNEGRTGLWRTTAEEIGKTHHSLTDDIYFGGKKHSKIKKKRRTKAKTWWRSMEDALDMQIRHQGALLGQARGHGGRTEGGKWEGPCMLLPLPSLKDDISLRWQFKKKKKKVLGDLIGQLIWHSCGDRSAWGGASRNIVVMTHTEPCIAMPWLHLILSNTHHPVG